MFMHGDLRAEQVMFANSLFVATADERIQRELVPPAAAGAALAAGAAAGAAAGVGLTQQE